MCRNGVALAQCLFIFLCGKIHYLHYIFTKHYCTHIFFIFVFKKTRQFATLNAISNTIPQKCISYLHYLCFVCNESSSDTATTTCRHVVPLKSRALLIYAVNSTTSGAHVSLASPQLDAAAPRCLDKVCAGRRLRKTTAVVPSGCSTSTSRSSSSSHTESCAFCSPPPPSAVARCSPHLVFYPTTNTFSQRRFLCRTSSQRKQIKPKKRTRLFSSSSSSFLKEKNDCFRAKCLQEGIRHTAVVLPKRRGMQSEHQCFTGASGRRGWEPIVLQRDQCSTRRKMVSGEKSVRKPPANTS